MNFRKAWFSVFTIAVALVAACGGTTSNNSANQSGTLTVWLMNGSAPQSVVDGVNADFKAKYPNITVKVELQQWGDIGTKLDTAYAGSTPPDVVELGNTLVAKYAAAGALEDIGGNNATQSGSKWTGALNSSSSQQGLTTLSNIVSQLSRADKSGDEAKQDAAFAQGHIAMIIANGWEVGVITDPKAGDPTLKDKLGAFAIPSHNAGQTAPVFLGGSDLAVAAKSKLQDVANAWVQTFTDQKNMAQMATVGGVIPNNTSQLNLASGLNSVFFNAAKNSRFVPNSQNWANVENANVLPDMLVKIFTKQQDIPTATKAASDRITSILNGGGSSRKEQVQR